jgi:hypothetical protein
MQVHGLRTSRDVAVAHPLSDADARWPGWPASERLQEEECVTADG